MESYNTTITLDVNAQKYFPVVKVKQYDTARTITVILKSGGQPYSFEGVSKVQFRCEKPDGHAVKMDANRDEGNKIVISLADADGQCTVVDGKAICDVVCLDSGDGVLSSSTFIMEIVKSPDVENTLVSSDAYKELEDAIRDAQRYGDVFELIPDEASPQNQLSDKAYVQNLIDSVAGRIAYILEWFAEPTQVQKEANVAVLQQIYAATPGTYEVIIKDGNVSIFATSVNGNSKWVQGSYSPDLETTKVYNFYGSTTGNYGQELSVLPSDVFDDASPAPAAQTAIYEYINTRIGTTGNLNPSSYASVSDVSNHTSDTTIHVTSQDKTAWSAKYDLPSGGMPSTDMSSAVQASLALANSALQSISTASAQTLGGIKVGYDLNVYNDGTLTTNIPRYHLFYPHADATAQEIEAVQNYNITTLLAMASECSMQQINNKWTAYWSGCYSYSSETGIVLFAPEIANSYQYLPLISAEEKIDPGRPGAFISLTFLGIIDPANTQRSQPLLSIPVYWTVKIQYTDNQEWEYTETSTPFIPIATANQLGAIKVGDNLNIDQNGVLSADEQVSTAERNAWDGAIPTSGTLTLLATAGSWTDEQDGTYTQQISITGGTANTKVDLQVSVSVIEQMQEDKITALYILNDDGDFYAVTVGNAPTDTITVQYTRTEVVTS